MLQVKKEWYAKKHYDNDVIRIIEPYIDPGVRCNIWLIKGRDKNLLIDSGFGVASLRDFIEEQTQKPLICLASHTHFDHIGCHHEFENRWVHQAEADILAAPNRSNTLIDSYVSADIFTAYPYEGFDPKTYNVNPAPATHCVADGDIIDLGNRAFEVVHLPGHSPGSIGLLEQASKTLYSGDAVYDGELYDDSYHGCPEDYMDSMARLLTLDVNTIHGGHYESFGAKKYRKIIAEYIAGKRKLGCPIEGFKK
ncbi:MBL fold metallo-hydrolase [Dasania marina]|uniref:MBL fold metallo-hydrolase n=1 Tax=Dasania marina TaxID=471499 RepID=UPI0030DCD9E7|tara:strand:- start:91655 stop:92410 length:756 start_codon:yes stop_codon:yes gene_type:complete